MAWNGITENYCSLLRTKARIEQSLHNLGSKQSKLTFPASFQSCAIRSHSLQCSGLKKQLTMC